MAPTAAAVHALECICSGMRFRTVAGCCQGDFIADGVCTEVLEAIHLSG